MDDEEEEEAVHGPMACRAMPFIRMVVWCMVRRPTPCVFHEEKKNSGWRAKNEYPEREGERERSAPHIIVIAYTGLLRSVSAACHQRACLLAAAFARCPGCPGCPGLPSSSIREIYVFKPDIRCYSKAFYCLVLWMDILRVKIDAFFVFFFINFFMHGFFSPTVFHSFHSFIHKFFSVRY